MDAILNDTRDIHPIFWERYYGAASNQPLNETVSHKTELNHDLIHLFDLLLFIIDTIYDIYMDTCSSYIDILNLLCIYTALSREINLFLVALVTDKSVLDSILLELITVSSIITNSPEDMIMLDNESQEAAELFKKKVETSKVSAKKLYLKINNII
jgi:hypothetical protein